MNEFPVISNSKPFDVFLKPRPLPKRVISQLDEVIQFIRVDSFEEIKSLWEENLQINFAESGMRVLNESIHLLCVPDTELFTVKFFKYI